MIGVSSQAWRDAALARLPMPWQGRARHKYDDMGGLFARPANEWLRDMAARMDRVRIPLDASDSEIRELARKLARQSLDLADNGGALTVEDYRAKLEKFAAGYGIRPPDADTDTGAIRRMTDKQWWVRQLRSAQGRLLEGEAIRLGYVGKGREPYASELTVQRRTQQKARNAAMMAQTVAINLTTAQEFQLAEIAERSNANPKIRRGELMVRIKGFEHIAEGCGHAALFVTQTCPSRMHPKKHIGGRVVANDKYDGTTPKQAQTYLTKTWAKVRAALARRKVGYYGFRVVEAHHDGTPHWHLLVFMPKAVRGMFFKVYQRYAMQADAAELKSKEARRARFFVKAMDASKGGAAAYIAKYISKNIDGYQVQRDIETGADAVSMAPRIEAWASAWGIRQFQQLGGAPVGVWRELRRLREADAEHSATMADARTAADVGNWRRYIEVMGGALAKRKDLPLRAARTEKGERINPETGEITEKKNRYEEPAARAVYGVQDRTADAIHISRFYVWAIAPAQGRAAAPWTRVNNCTGAPNGPGGTGQQNGQHKREIQARIGNQMGSEPVQPRKAGGVFGNGAQAPGRVGSGNATARNLAAHERGRQWN